MKTEEDYIKENGCEHDGSFVPISEVKRLMTEFAALAVAEATKDCYPKSFIEWFTGEKSPVSILYGNQAERFAAMYTDYTIDELFDYWKNLKK